MVYDTRNVPHCSCGVVMRLRTRSYENFTELTRSKWSIIRRANGIVVVASVLVMQL